MNKEQFIKIYKTYDGNKGKVLLIGKHIRQIQ